MLVSMEEDICEHREVDKMLFPEIVDLGKRNNNKNNCNNKNSNDKSSKNKKWFLKKQRSLYFGIISIFLGISTAIFQKDIFNLLRRFNMELVPGSLRYRMWVENIRPFTMDIYFFNWTNPEDIYDPNVKPKYEEIGPYTFIQKRRKVDVVTNKENGTTTFKQNRAWNYVETPGLSLDDPISTLNAVAMTSGYKLRHKPYFLKAAVSAVLRSTNTKLHVMKKASELIYEGYEDKILDLTRNIPFLPRDLTSHMKNFSWFYGWNNSADLNGVFNVVTDFEDSGRLKMWNYEKTTPFLNEGCNNIDGFFGDQFPMDLKKEDMDIFSIEICNDIPFEYEEEAVYMSFNSYKYSVGEKMLDNGTKYPERICTNGGENLPAGVTNISSCWYNSPTFLSLPHFFKADKHYSNNVEGMKPVKEKHNFYVAIEPNTGIVTDARIRVQLNFLLQPYEGIGLFKNTRKIMLPILWFEVSTGIHQNHVFLVQLLLHSPLIMITSAIISILMGFYLVYKTTFKAKQMPKRSYQKLKNFLFIP